MQLEIGSKTYQFQIVPGPLKRRGRRSASVCDHTRRRIRVSAAVPAEVRAEVTALAVSEAWRHETIQRPPVKFVGDVE